MTEEEGGDRPESTEADSALGNEKARWMMMRNQTDPGLSLVGSLDQN